MLNPNSSLIWLPKIEAAGLPVPRTIVIPYSHRAIVDIFDGLDSPSFTLLIDGAQAAARKIGYPVFVRTDLGSAKHAGPKAYKIENGESAGRVLYQLLEDQEMKFWLDEAPQAILVREFLELEAPFTAFGGLPISREWRFFADPGGVRCAHPYWPEDAIDFFGKPEPDGWREQLAELHWVVPEGNRLRLMAMEAATACGVGEWSVDFAREKDGTWWLLDMATAADSYHWPECPRAAKERDAK